MTLADWKKSQIQKRKLPLYYLLQLLLYFLILHLLPLLQSSTLVVGCVDVVVVVTNIVIVVFVVVVIVIVIIVFSILPFFLSLYLDFFFCQHEPTLIVKGFELNCLNVIQFSCVKSSQIEESAEFVFGLSYRTKTLSQL